jgi:hypothetical protein
MSYVELGLEVLGGLASAATIEKVRAAAVALGPVVGGGAAGMPHPHGWTAGDGQGRWGSAGMEPEEAHTRKKHMQRRNWRKKHARGRTERGRRGCTLSSRRLSHDRGFFLLSLMNRILLFATIHLDAIILYFKVFVLIYFGEDWK